MLHILYTTLPDASAAHNLARDLVEAQLVACANVMPAHHAFYRWEGALCEAQEVALWCKTPETRLADAMAHIRAQHPYETPCLLAWPASHADAAYALWAQQSTGLKA